MSITRAIPPVSRLVVKVGSAVIAPGGNLSQDRADQLADDLAAVRASGVEITLVSSGAIASGFRLLGLDAPPADIVQKQAAAALGQHRLMLAWERAMVRFRVPVAQVLLISDDFVNRTRYLNARRVLGELHTRSVLPVINENDTVSYDEIRFGDNDALAAHVAGLIQADLLLVLSTASGLYENGDPARVIPAVEMSGPAQLAALNTHVSKEKTLTGVGGMASKLHAMNLASSLGVPAIIAQGSLPGVITRVLHGEQIGTYFKPATTDNARARDAWILAGVRVTGSLTIDDGARKALLERGASLLPSGVTGVQGTFSRGSTVDVLDAHGTLLARGLCAYSDDEARRIAGKRSDQIEAILGYALGEELVHRDDLVVMTKS